MPEKIDFELGFDYEKRHAQQRMEQEAALYAQARPYETEAGHFSPDGEPINADQWFAQEAALAMDTQLEAEAEASYENLTPAEVAKELAQAEFEGTDPMLQSHLKAVLAGKVYGIVEREKQHADDLSKEHNINLEHFDEGSDEDRRAARMASLMSLKDKQLKRLRNAEGGQPDQDVDDTADADTQKLDAVNTDGSAASQGRIRGLVSRVRARRDRGASATTPEATKPQDEGESFAERQQRTEERKKEFQGYKAVRYQRDTATGNIRLASEFTQEGTIIPLAKVEKPMIVLTKDGGEYYLPEGYRGQMVDSNRTVDDKRLTTLENIAEMSQEQLDGIKIVVGENLKIGDTELGEVEAVEIAEGSTNIETNAHELRDEEDPFTRNERVIMGAITATRESAPTNGNGDKPVDPQNSQDVRDRMKDAWYAAGARLQRVLSRGEKKDNKTRQRAAAPVVGAQAVGSAILPPDLTLRPEQREEAEAA